MVQAVHTVLLNRLSLMMVYKAIALGTPVPKTHADGLIFCFPLSFVIFHRKICLDHKAFQTWQPTAYVKPKCSLKLTKPTSQMPSPDFQSAATEPFVFYSLLSWICPKLLESLHSFIIHSFLWQSLPQSDNVLWERLFYSLLNLTPFVFTSSSLAPVPENWSFFFSFFASCSWFYRFLPY